MTFRTSRRSGVPRAATIVVLFAGTLVAFASGGVAHAFTASFVVNTAGNADDSVIDGSCDTDPAPGDQCTLRAAIQEANADPGVDTIGFALPAPYTITLTSAGLPAITDPVLIDGTTLPSFDPAGGTIVRVDGATDTTAVAYDFDVQAGGSGTTISGLEIERAGSAGVLFESDDNVVSGDYIGTTAADATDCAPSVSCSNNVGVLIDGGAGNTVGGTAAADRNVIANNSGYGIELESPAGPVTIQNNDIGTDGTGAAGIGNGDDGIRATSVDDLTVDDNVIAGNTSTGQQVRIDYGDDDTFRGNIIGLAADGTTAIAGGWHGLEINYTTDSVVDANTISNNTETGLYAYGADGLTVTNNKIGTDSAGTVARGNGDGILLEKSTDAQVGTAAGGNLVAGNTSAGIEAFASTDSSIAGNLVGTDATGANPLPNAGAGILLNQSARMSVGGADIGPGNIVATATGCCEPGIFLSGADDNTILGNRVGVAATGAALPGGDPGILLDPDSDANQLGGTASGAGNVIANAGGAGIAVRGLDDQVRGNSIHDNAGLGIDLGNDGVTPNDPGDGDTGANRLQNFPVLTASVSNAGSTQVSGTLGSRPDRQYAIDFYANTDCDSSGYGEGETYLGSTTVTTDDAGNVGFQATVPVPAPAGSQVSATATDVALGDTSEFSACLADQGGLPSASVANTSASEGAGTMAFTISLSSAPVATPVTVDYATADGTATSPADYTATSGTVTFLAGDTTEQVNVPIVDDALDENNETLTLTLSNATNAVVTPGQATATGTILDDDPPPTVSITSVRAVTEPDTGSVNQAFIVRLSAPSALPVSVIIETVPGTASEDVDYVGNAARLTFAAGTTVKTFDVAVLGDTIDEFNEKYTARLLSPTNATIGIGSRTATINDNDPPPSLSISDVSAPEGDSGTTAFAFTLTLSQASGKNVRIAIPGPTDGTATAPSDYVARRPVLLDLRPGQTSIRYVVQVKGDTRVEPDETFYVDVDPATTKNATVVDGTGVGTIQNDD